MIITTKIEAVGDRRVIRKFCWFPFTHTVGLYKTVVWLDYVEVVQECDEFGWFTVSFRVITKGEYREQV